MGSTPPTVEAHLSLTLRRSSCLDRSKSHRFYRRDMGRVAPRRHYVVRTHSHIRPQTIRPTQRRERSYSSSADPTSCTIPELVENLRDTGADLIVVHPDFLDKIAGVAGAAGIPLHRILLLDRPKSSSGELPYPLLGDLIAGFDANHEHFTERKLANGSAISKPAFYVISHGLSGMPKV